jgi:hypothetical protein
MFIFILLCSLSYLDKRADQSIGDGLRAPAVYDLAEIKKKKNYGLSK